MGILRMDVDNLGSIFQSGIPREKASMARYAALSRSFDFFFSGYVNNIVLQDEFAEKSFIVYSGGDDLFIVGEWNKVIEIAKTIREDFREYTCRNPMFSISGGVAILEAQFPLIRGAEESAFEESNAKNHTCNGKTKDALSFMDTPLHWGEEFPIVEALKNELVELLRNELPNSFLSKVLLHAAKADMVGHKIRNVRTYWLMSYDMKRVMERTKNEKVKQLAINCQKEIWSRNGCHLNGEPIKTDYHPLELWAFACRWAELEYRMLNKK